jgi:N-methylhydantoinase A
MSHMTAEASLQVGLDIGGTFTDCAVIGADGLITSAKALTTHEDPSIGFFDALVIAADRRGLSLEALLERTTHVFHGTTVATNALVERSGARTGVLTTRGAGDSLTIMRAFGRVAGISIEEVIRASVTSRPEPIVSRDRIHEVDERVDSQGNEVVSLDEDGVRAAVLEMVDSDIEAIAICFLWSFLNPSHEIRAQEMVREIAPAMYVTRSSALVPKWGEYERLAATSINCYVGPAVERYVSRLTRGLDERGYSGQALFLECQGGVMTRKRARDAPLQTIASGPAGGLVGAAYLATAQGHANVICTDMGGTSFDVGLIVDGRPVTATTTTVSQYQYFVPCLDIRSIGAGGGSFVRFDPVSGTMKVGPGSAGGDPGPVCYGRGGTIPTVTDADVVLGCLDPESFLGGRLVLDREAAVEAFETVANEVGLDVLEAAAGACQIIDHRMADVIAQMSIQQGRDPREFIVYAYGGAGPLHAGSYARELGCREIVVPLGDPASVWSAFGAAHSDLRDTAELTDIQTAPFDARRFNADLGHVAGAAVASLVEQGATEAAVVVSLSVDLRYRGQLYEVKVPIARAEPTPSDLEELPAAFGARYERLFGKGAGFPAAGVEAVVFRAEAVAAIERHRLISAHAPDSEPPAEAVAKPKRVYWGEERASMTTPVYRGARLRPGNQISGPAIIDLPETTILVRPGQDAKVDRLGSVVIRIGGEG